MEPLWSQAGATGGNRPQAHLPVAEVVMNPESIDDRQLAMYAAATGRAAAGRVPGGRVWRPVRLASFNPEPTLPGGKEHPASAQEGAHPAERALERQLANVTLEEMADSVRARAGRPVGNCART